MFYREFRFPVLHPYDKFENTVYILVNFKGDEISEGNLIFI